MKIAIRTLFWLVAGAVLLFAPPALADSASMVLTGVGPNGAMAGVYVGPYVATIDGVSTPIICDDFADESYLNESWTANVTTLANLSGTKWGGLNNATTLYEEAAWLTEQLVNAPQSQAGDIQFAIWAIFDPSAIDGLSAGDQTTVENLITQAEGETFWAGEFSNILIYTADMNDPILCNGQACANTPPQEFLVDTPEPGALALLSLGLSVIAIGARRKKSWNRILSLA
jgi:PEP-CTERM motif